MHIYNVDKEDLSWLKAGHHIIMLYEEDAFMTIYLTLINMVLSLALNVVFRVITFYLHFPSQESYQRALEGFEVV